MLGPGWVMRTRDGTVTLENVSTISQIIATFVVAASLIAILIATYQTNKIAKADLTLQVWLATGALQLSLVDSTEKAEFLFRALRQPEALTGPEKMRLRFSLGVALGTHQAGFNLRKRGLIESGAYVFLEETTRRYMRSPALQDYWHKIGRHTADPDFRDLLDRMVNETEGPEHAAPSVGTS